MHTYTYTHTHTHTHTHIYTHIHRTHTHTMENYSAIKNNEILTFASMWMELESIMLSEIVRERQILYDFTHMWNLRKKQTKEKTEKPRNGFFLKNFLMFFIFS